MSRKNRLHSYSHSITDVSCCFIDVDYAYLWEVLAYPEAARTSACGIRTAYDHVLVTLGQTYDRSRLSLSLL